MKSMKKALNGNKVIGSLKKRTTGLTGNSGNNGEGSQSPAEVIEASGQSPEATAHNAVKSFCESGGNVQGDEILFLPAIVDAAESSPAAAAECARVIRKFLDKSYNSRPSWQYNGLMLIRILTDNPGETFTRNLDAEFAETCRKLLKHGRDGRVRQMLMETLDDFEHTKMYDENLKPLVEMWKAQKEEVYKKHGAPPAPQRRNTGNQMQPPANPHSQNYFARNHQTKGLPDPVQLASRLEEARTSAKLLEQVVMNTPPAEIINSDLIKEFANRCLSASRSIQGYMTAENPPPDNDTMESLIDTNEQIQTALNQHQRAVLNARKQLGLNERSPEETPNMTPGANGNDRVLEWQRTQSQLLESGVQPESPDLPAQPYDNGKGKGAAYNNGVSVSGGAQASGSGLNRDDDDDPFRDPHPEDADQRHQHDPFNPGFQGAGGSGPAGRANDAGGAGRAPMRDDVSDDLYDADPAQKQPVYRY